MKKLQNNNDLVNSLIIFGLILLLGFVLLNILNPFIPVIFISIIVVIFYHPVYKWNLKYLKNKVLSSLLTLILAIFSLFIPIFVLTALAVQDVENVVNETLDTLTQTEVLDSQTAGKISDFIVEKLSVSEFVNTTNKLSIDSIQNEIKDALQKNVTNSLISLDQSNNISTKLITDLERSDLSNQLVSNVESYVNRQIESSLNEMIDLDYITDSVKQSILDSIILEFESSNIFSIDNITGDISINLEGILNNSSLINRFLSLVPQLLSTLTIFTDFLFKFFVLLFLIFFLFIEFENIPKYVERFSPLKDKLDLLLYEKFLTTTKSVIKGSFVVAMVHSTSIAIPMLIFDIPGVAIWWIIMFFASILPIGAGIISIPIGLFMIFAPQYSGVEGAILIAYSLLSINLIESIVRPQLTKTGTGLHPILILLTSLGGIIYFASPLGILYGQLVAVFYQTIIKAYLDKNGESKEITE